ncbi:DUF3168 domain-containing protein [Phenylobacterium sp.]|uniref:tail completion protein gp17 n=1 Tax=Phenylobacterium sp. TaxID=1871053 RepID=UPI00395768C6
MPSPAEPFRAAEEAALRASTALLTAMGGDRVRYYTAVPANTAPPYVVGGIHEIADDSGGCGRDHTIVATLRWFGTDADQVRRMGDAIIDALFVELPITGHETVLVEMETPEAYRTEPDGSSSGLVGFRYETSAL